MMPRPRSRCGRTSGGFRLACCCVGGTECLLDDSRNLAAKLEREGVQVDYREYEDMVHVWPLFSEFLPEAQEALREIGAFVGARVAGASG